MQNSANEDTPQLEFDVQDLLLVLDAQEQRSLHIVASVLLSFHRNGWAPFAHEHTAAALRQIVRLTMDLERGSDTEPVISQILRVLIAGGSAEPGEKASQCQP